VRRIRPETQATSARVASVAESQRDPSGPTEDARIDSVDRVQDLLARGAQLVEVLPEQEYREERLPGAINIPLKALDAETTARLDKRNEVVVYCWDAL
jgi:rhodanese-related sulfurtransferase